MYGIINELIMMSAGGNFYPNYLFSIYRNAFAILLTRVCQFLFFSYWNAHPCYYRINPPD